MDNGENTTKKKTFKLTKVNSRDGSNVVYDAYGYEIKTGDRPRSEPPRSNAAEADGPVPEPARRAAAETERDDPELLRTERRTYNADIRAAIESGAHRRTHEPADSVTGDRPRSGYDSVTGDRPRSAAPCRGKFASGARGRGGTRCAPLRTGRKNVRTVLAKRKNRTKTGGKNSKIREKRSKVE